MEKFIEELQAFCKRSNHKIVFLTDGSISQRTVSNVWVRCHNPESLIALVREGNTRRCLVELLAIAKAHLSVDNWPELKAAVEASEQCLAQSQADRRYDAENTL